MVVLMEDGIGNHIILRDNVELQRLNEMVARISEELPAYKYMSELEEMNKIFVKTPEEVFKLMSQLSIVTTKGNKKIHMAFMEE